MVLLKNYLLGAAVLKILDLLLLLISASIIVDILITLLKHCK